MGLCFNGVYQKDDFDENGNLKEGVTRIVGVKSYPGDMKFKDLTGDGIVDPVNDKKSYQEVIQSFLEVYRIILK